MPRSSHWYAISFAPFNYSIHDCPQERQISIDTYLPHNHNLCGRPFATFLQCRLYMSIAQ